MDYGRMNATLGGTLPNTMPRSTTHSVRLRRPSTEVDDAAIPARRSVRSETARRSGRSPHNGVDTHSIHFHLFNVQLINRVGWDGMVRSPDPNELGWKETVRMNPLEDVIVALRPVMPEPAVRSSPTASGRSTDRRCRRRDDHRCDPPTAGHHGNQHVTDYGWEYVWHCHLLGHEENDMMRPIKFNVPRALAAPPAVTVFSSAGGLNLTWTDGTSPTPAFGVAGTTWGSPQGEIGYRIDRAVVTGGIAGAYGNIGTALANQTSFTDPNASPGTTYSYVVTAFNAAGDSPSAPVQAQLVGTLPSAPLSVMAVAGTGLGAGTATVSSSAPTSDGLSAITQYDVTSSGLSPQTCTATMPGPLSCVVSGLTLGTSYTFTVTATNGSGTGPASAPSTR